MPKKSQNTNNNPNNMGSSKTIPIKFTLQKPDDKEEEIPIKTLIERIQRLGSSESVQKASLIEKSNAVKKLLDKAGDNNCTKRELSMLKNIFYDEEDYDQESTVADLYQQTNEDKSLTKREDFIQLATYDIIFQRAQQLKKTLEDPKKKKEIFRVVKEERLTKEEVQKKVQDQKDQKNVFADCLDEPNALAEMEWNAILENDMKNKPLILPKEPDNKGPNWDNKEKEEIRNKKRQILEEIKNKKKAKNDEVINLADELNAKYIDILNSWQALSQVTSDPSISNLQEGKKETWARMDTKQFRNPGKQLNDLVVKCASQASGSHLVVQGVTLQLSCVLMSIINKMGEMYQVIQDITAFIKAQYNKDIKIAKGGDKTWADFNKRINFNNAVNNGKINKVEKNEWDKLSSFQKLTKKFVFEDYRQMPNHSLWKKLKVSDKVKFLELRNSFREKRLIDLMELAKTDPLKAATRFDLFMYYQWRDCTGYACQAKDENKNQYGDKSEDAPMIEELNTIRETYNGKKLIFNKYYINGMKKYSYGRSIIAIRAFNENKNNNNQNDQNNDNNNEQKNNNNNYKGNNNRNYNNNKNYRYKRNNYKNSKGNPGKGKIYNRFKNPYGYLALSNKNNFINNNNNGEDKKLLGRKRENNNNEINTKSNNETQMNLEEDNEEGTNF